MYNSNYIKQNQINSYAFYWTAVPKKPSSLLAYRLDDSIRLRWTAPERGLFRTEYYYIEVTTCTSWKDKHGFQVPAVPLEHSIMDIISDKTYYFKIYAVSGSVRSEATCQSCLPIRKLSFLQHFRLIVISIMHLQYM